MKMVRSLTALGAAFLLFVSPLVVCAAERTPGESPGNGLPGGVDIIGGWNYDLGRWDAAHVDEEGNVGVRNAVEPLRVVAHWTGKTIGAGAADSSASAFDTRGYKQAYLLWRFHNAATGAAAAIAWRSHLGATIDTTGTWYSQIGANTRGGTNVTFNASLGDGLGASGTGSYRMYRIALMDSIPSGARQMLRPADWSSVWVKNLSGAAMVVDLWIELHK